MNNSTYVGSGLSLSKRIGEYYNKNELERNPRPIHAALLKYGYENFKLQILEYCRADELIKREQYYLDLLNPNYNILKNAYSLLGFKHSAENIAKFKLKKVTQEHKDILSSVHLNKVVSQETRNKLSIATTKFKKNNPLTPEALANITAKTTEREGVSVTLLNSLVRIRSYHTNNSKLNITPLVSFDNPDTQKLEIYNEIKGKAGVYRWVYENKSYIGSSTNLRRRIFTYYSLKYLSLWKNSIIGKALLKYGYSSFRFEILEYCEPEKCLEREQYYLDLLKPEYNILKKAGSSLGFKHSEETVIKISTASKGNQKAKGLKHSEETKAKISVANKGNTYATGYKNAIGHIGAGRISIEVLDLETGIKKNYSSMKEAALALGVPHGSISIYLSRGTIRPFKGRFKLMKNWIFLL